MIKLADHGLKEQIWQFLSNRAMRCTQIQPFHILLKHIFLNKFAWWWQTLYSRKNAFTRLALFVHYLSSKLNFLSTSSLLIYKYKRFYLIYSTHTQNLVSDQRQTLMFSYLIHFNNCLDVYFPNYFLAKIITALRIFQFKVPCFEQ